MTIGAPVARIVGARRWRRVARLCQAAIAVLVCFGVWSIGFVADDGPAAVVPETSEQFSLDLEVLATADLATVYAVEQRARPAYRIFGFDPVTGTDTTVFTVPEDAIVYGIALSPDATTLAVTYTPDYELGGAGLWLLDLYSGSLTMVSDVETGVFHVDPTWTDDGTAVLTTRVDRTGAPERLAVGQISIDDGASSVVAADIIAPAVIDGSVYGLTIDADLARRGIARVDDGGVAEIASGDVDLDHLVADDTGTLAVAAIATADGGGLTVGSAASAHGNHDAPSTWWQVDVDAAEPSAAASSASTVVVYDAAGANGVVVMATSEGLAVADLGTGVRTDLIASRAIRLVAG